MMMQGSWSRWTKVVVLAGVAAAVTLGVAGPASSRIAGGSGKQGDCYAEFDNITSSRAGGQPRVDCKDGDACDTDGDCHNGSCTVKVGVCINQSDVANCTPPATGLKKLKALPGKYKSLVSDLQSKLAGPACGPLVNVVVKTSKHGKKPGKQQLRLIATAGRPNKPPVDNDSVIINCIPRPASEQCPVNTTTTTSVTTTTTTTTTTTSTLCTPCTCAGGAPTRLSFTTGIGSGDCGHLDADGNPNFFPLKCGGLYFGGAGVGVPLPAAIPDQGVSLLKTTCCATTLSLSNLTSTDTGSNRNCTSVGCLFGQPLPIPNGSHLGSTTSTCVINTVSANAVGTADCNAGSTTGLNLPLSSGLFLTGDSLLPNRCDGGTNLGGSCTTVGAACPGGGTCVNDTGRCANNGNPCNADPDCPSSTCERGACVGGGNAGKGCILDTDCPGSTCRTFIQPCPICNATSLKCNGGPNDGLTCHPDDTAVNGDYPTSHDCPPPAGSSLGILPIAFLLDSGTQSKTSGDLPNQVNVFCGFCRNKITPNFKNPAVPCTADANCAGVTGFTSCGQKNSGAFTGNDIARTIVAQGVPAGALTTGGPGKPSKIVSIFCIPPTFNTLVDSAADLPGPGMTALEGTVQLLP
jgi:hypothetical protein